MFSWRAILSLLCAILLMPISSILVKFAKQHRLETNEPPFLPFAASMIIEFVKGVMCLLIYACCGPSSGDGGSSSDKSNDDDGEPISAWQHVKNSFMYAIPATLYAVDNNLFFVVLRLVTPATLHLLANIKIVFVALLFRFALRRAVNRVQWAALLLLIVGLIVARLDDPHATSAVSASATRSGAFIVANASAASSASPPNSALSTLAPSALSTGSVQQPSQFSAITQGFLLVVLMTACSSVANIALEHLYKTHRQHMLLQQFQLYLYGVALNLACLLAYDYHTIATEGVLRGFNAFVWAVVAASSFTGIAVSFVLKYSDNIGNVFAHAGGALQKGWILFRRFCVCSIWVYHFGVI